MFIPTYCWWTKSCTSWYGKYPIKYKVLYIKGGAGFCPSTVWLSNFNKNTVSKGSRCNNHYSPYPPKRTPDLQWLKRRCKALGTLNPRLFHENLRGPFPSQLTAIWGTLKLSWLCLSRFKLEHPTSLSLKGWQTLQQAGLTSRQFSDWTFLIICCWLIFRKLPPVAPTSRKMLLQRIIGLHVAHVAR